MKQSEIIKRISDEELRKQLLFSQSIFFLLSIVLSVFMFDGMTKWFQYFSFKWNEIFFYGICLALLVVTFEIFLYSVLPKYLFDDGGINQKIFENQSVGWIAVISIVVAVSEEMLFRGVIQVSFGYIFASSLFAIVHIRYLKKPILFILIVLLSFLLGYLFFITENLLVTIVFHFLVDFLLGLFIRYKK